MKYFVAIGLAVSLILVTDCKNSPSAEKQNMESLDSTTVMNNGNIVKADSVPVQIDSVIPDIQKINSLSEIYKASEKKPQIFMIYPDRYTIINCEEGTKIEIDVNSFIVESTGKEVAGKLKIAVKEYYKKSDLLLANLSTTSNGSLLETGGMIYIDASSNNEKCKLKEGEVIKISFAAKDLKSGMKLYTGDRVNLSRVNWKDLEEEEEEEVGAYSFGQATEISNYPSREPEFPGGKSKLQEYVSEHLKYPLLAKKNREQGKVNIRFEVSKSGEIKKVKLIKGLSAELNRDALNLVKNMPKWIPGGYDGKNMSMERWLGIHYYLEEDKILAEPIDKIIISGTGSNVKVRTVNADTLMEKFFSISQLGWINLDHLLNQFKNRRIDYIVKGEEGSEMQVRILFHNFKSIMDGVSKGKDYIFKNIGSEEPITIIAIKRKENQIYLAIKETQTSNINEKDLLYQPMTMETIQKELRKIDRIN